MSRYAARSSRPAKTVRQTPAIWRGIGCLLIIIVPLISWFMAKATVALALTSGWPLPYQLLGYPLIPAPLWTIPGAAPILLSVRGQQHLYLTLLFMIAYVVAISGVLSLLYAVIYHFAGPPRYGPLDLPQPQIKVGRYKR